MGLPIINCLESAFRGFVWHMRRREGLAIGSIPACMRFWISKVNLVDIVVLYAPIKILLCVWCVCVYATCVHA